MNTLKLYAVCLGGRMDRCNTELHDIVFVIGYTLQDTCKTLVKKWFGNSERLHVDSHIELRYVDGHEIVISPTSNKLLDNTGPRLFFVNFGAYDPKILGEVHQSAFFVGKDKSEALAKAKELLCTGLFQPHCDDNLNVAALIGDETGDVDDIIELTEIDGFRIQLIPSEETQPFKTICGYRKIDVASMTIKNTTTTN